MAAATGVRWAPGEAQDGSPIVRAEMDDGSERIIRVTREGDPASMSDVHFIAHARHDLTRLIAWARDRENLPGDELDAIDARSRAASKGPWKVFLEREGGVGGSNVIWVSEDDDEPDLYLWLDTDLAPAEDFVFVAEARQDVPALVGEVRARR